MHTQFMDRDNTESLKMHLKVTIVAGKFGSVEASGTPTEGQRALY
jgi:hypothetical protein